MAQQKINFYTPNFKRLSKHLGIFLLAFITFGFGPCTTTTSDPEQKQQSYEYIIGTPTGGNKKAKEKLLEIIGSAQKELIMGFSEFNDDDVYNAIMAKEAKGLKIAIAGDRRNENTGSFQKLKNLRPSKFRSTKTAFADAVAANNVARETEILRTRLNFNGQNQNARYNAAPYDGKLEYNILVADSNQCWVSTSPPTDATWDYTYSVVFVFNSYDLCRDFYNELNQPALGGLFGDEGTPSFGKFRYNKSVADPNNYFRIEDLSISVWFSPQEWPLAALITELMRSEDSIEFAARALTQDQIVDVANHAKNRSHILNVFEYKSRVPTIYNKSFSIKGVMGTEYDTNPTCVEFASNGSCSKSVNYDTLVSGTCPEINSATIDLPYWRNSTRYENTISIKTSIHCDLKDLQAKVNNSSILTLRKYNSKIPFNIFILDKNSRRPRILISPSDFRRRYFYDDGGMMSAEPARTQDDFFPISDSFLMMIEPINMKGRKKIFNDFSKLIDIIFQAGHSW